MIEQSCPQNIDIYGEAVLTKSNFDHTAPISINRKTKIFFPIEGELSGFAVCETSSQINKSLFSESMNILLGQILTNLEIESKLLSKIGTPILIRNNISISQYEITSNFKYTLRSTTSIYECDVNFYANKNLVKGV